MDEAIQSELLGRAAAAEQKLQRILATRGSGSSPDASFNSDDTSFGIEDDGTILELVEPDSSVSWAMRILPRSSELVSLPPGEAGLSTTFVDGLARTIPQVADALTRGVVFELIGPSEAIVGLRAGTLELIPSHNGLLGGIRRVGEKKILHQARFRPVKLAKSIGPGLVLAAASAVVGHIHMLEIRKQLASIEARVDRVIEAQQADRHGKLMGAVMVLEDLALMGSHAWSDVDRARLANVDINLKQVWSELDKLNLTYSERSSACAKSGLAGFAQRFGSIRQVEIDDARLYAVATCAMVLQERLMLENARLHAPSGIAAREQALQTALARLTGAEQALGHLRTFQDHCRKALIADQERAFRFSVSENEKVSDELARDRSVVADLFSAIGRMCSSTNESVVAQSTNNAQVVRIDGRGASLVAQTAQFSID